MTDPADLLSIVCARAGLPYLSKNRTLNAAPLASLGVVAELRDGVTQPDSRENSMRIAQVAPLQEAVPPKLYGGTERIVSFLTEELVTLGHEVTLFASGDSE